MQIIADKYTRPLITSHERASFFAVIAAALVGVRSAPERVAVAADVAERRRRRGDGFLDALAKVDKLREQRVAVGDVGCGQPPTCPIGPNTQRQCYIDGRRICDYDRVGSRTLTTAGNAAFAIVPAPAAGSAWWRPKATRAWAFRTDDPSIPAWEGLFITSITVGTAPVEGFNTLAPTAATQQGIFFGDYVVPDGDAIGVGWPVFSNTANEQQLSIQGIGLWPAAAAYIAGFSVLGNRYDPGTATESRCHNGSAPLPNTYSADMGSSIP